MEVKKITKEELQEAISEGVERAFWRMITNATAMPTADFFDSVEQGVMKAMLTLKRWEDEEK
jgi:hypothetical protein